MVDLMVSIYRCPECGYEVLTPDKLDDDDKLECGNCNVEMIHAGHRDITVED